MKKTFQFFFILIFSFTTCAVFAAKVDTVRTYSNVMHKEIKAIIVTPDNYVNNKPLPVVYLLHGYSDNYSAWATKDKGFEALADTYNLIIVCPDGNYNTWYFDSPVDKDSQYETYVSKELVSWVDEHYATIANRNGRAITGLSMGGHGALYLAIKHQDVFGAAGSMSGGVDIRPFPGNWEIEKKLGSYAQYPDRWEKNTVINLLYLLKPNSLALIIDCGSDDFFYKVNCKLHEQLLYRNIPHDFISRPGAHSWDYWRNAVKYQMLFMNNYFQEKKSNL